MITSFDDFKNNYSQIQLLKSFLKTTLADDTENICILSGPLATGKTTLINFIRDSSDYDSKIITSIAQLRHHHKQLLLIDDIHLMDEAFISSVKDIQNIKIIVTVQGNKESVISELRNNSQRILYIRLYMSKKTTDNIDDNSMAHMSVPKTLKPDAVFEATSWRVQRQTVKPGQCQADADGVDDITDKVSEMSILYTSMMQLNIYNEYSMKSFEDFKSNYMQIQLLTSFLKSSLVSDTVNICIISGSLATGKTTLLDVIHNSSEYETVFITSESNYTTALKNFSTKTTIESILIGKQKILLIDDVHLLDKAFITSVKNIHNLKIIVTIQSKEEAKISDLRTNAMTQRILYIRLNRISFQDCFITVNDLLEKLNIQDKIPCDHIMSIIKDNNCNLRQILQYMSKKNTNTNGGGTMTPNVQDMNVYDLTNHFLKHKINEKFLCINSTNIVNYLIYENYANIFTMKIKTDSLNIYKTFLKNTILVNHDALQQDYSETKKIFEYYAMMKNNDMLHNKNNDNAKLKFTNIFNKLSMQSAFNKKMNTNITENENNCCKPLVRAMCSADKNDFMYKKLCADFK